MDGPHGRMESDNSAMDCGLVIKLLLSYMMVIFKLYVKSWPGISMVLLTPTTQRIVVFLKNNAFISLVTQMTQGQRSLSLFISNPHSTPDPDGPDPKP